MNKSIQMAKTSTELIWDYIATSAPSFRPTSICEASGWKWNAARLFCALYIVKCHAQTSFLFSLKKAELSGAAPRSLWWVWIPSLLKSILPQSWVFHHTPGERVFPLPGTEFMVEKNSITSQWRKASSSFPFYWTERRGSSEANAEQKPKFRALNWSLEVILLRGILRRFTWEAGCYQGGETPFNLCTLQPCPG